MTELAEPWRKGQHRLDVRSDGHQRSRSARMIRTRSRLSRSMPAQAMSKLSKACLVVYTDPTDLHRTREALFTAGYEVEVAQLTMRPKTLVAPEPEAAVKMIRLVEKLEDLDDVQEVFTNVDVNDEVLAAAL